ncbi:MAG: hypothetical protein H7263_06575 [Candidatus Sericytochromatia bacterium]|nr:hypothetical protein [Candidatus Sericytochromatia bacterium]
MIIIIINSSKKKAFRRSKRIIASVLQPISNRISLGDIPKRVLIELCKNLKISVTKGTSIQIFFESKNIGFRGFKCIQIGSIKTHLEEFTTSKSLIDLDLISNKLIINNTP